MRKTDIYKEKFLTITSSFEAYKNIENETAGAFKRMGVKKGLSSSTDEMIDRIWIGNARNLIKNLEAIISYEKKTTEGIPEDI